MKNNSLRHAYLTLGLLISIVIVGSVGYRMLGYTPSEAIYLINPLPGTRLTISDRLFALGTRFQIDRLIETISSEV